MRLIPIIMCRNEQFHIAEVLVSLFAVFPEIILGDTGSTDDTVKEALRVCIEPSNKGLHLMQFGQLDAVGLGQARAEMCVEAISRGYNYVLQCDADELYYPKALEGLIGMPLPGGKRLGFTRMVTIEPDKSGQMWMMSDWFWRAAVFPATDRWHGDYPFETPESFDLGSAVYHYYEPPKDTLVHGLHLHRLQRSPKDDEVMFRNEKRFQFSFQNQVHHRVMPVPYWPGEEYEK